LPASGARVSFRLWVWVALKLKTTTGRWTAAINDGD
jgi:hypothetical protein